MQMHAIYLILHSFLHPVFFPKETTFNLFQVFSIHHSSTMEKPRVTEIRVRMDCNGCVQKIKKALNGITGIYDLYVDFPQQKVTIIGWADPEKIVKAIKKTRKSAIICLHTEQPDQPTSEPPPPQPEGGGTADGEGGAPPPESNKPPTEHQQQQQQQTEPPPPPPSAEPQKDSPPPPPPPDNPPANANPSPESTNDTTTQPSNKPKDVEQIHVVYHHPPDYGHRYAYGGQWNGYPGGPGFGGDPYPQPQPQPPQPMYVNHSYNTYKPSPYVTEYAYPNSQPQYSHYNRQEQYNNQAYQPQPAYSNYGRPDHYSSAYNYNGNYNNGNGIGNGNGTITSMFSEENPNACSIV